MLVYAHLVFRVLSLAQLRYHKFSLAVGRWPMICLHRLSCSRIEYNLTPGICYRHSGSSSLEAIANQCLPLIVLREMLDASLRSDPVTVRYNTLIRFVHVTRQGIFR